MWILFEADCASNKRENHLESPQFHGNSFVGGYRDWWGIRTIHSGSLKGGQGESVKARGKMGVDRRPHMRIAGPNVGTIEGTKQEVRLNHRGREGEERKGAKGGNTRHQDLAMLENQRQGLSVLYR